MALRAQTDCVEATRGLAAAIADLVGPGDLLLLAGELGAGKTAFTQALGAALGIEETITSPTFTLARHYEGRVALHHIDVYRLERFSELQDIGVPELLDGSGVVVIEWGDAVARSLPNDFLEVRFSYGEGDDDRQIDLDCVGPTWAARERTLIESIEKWAVA